MEQVELAAVIREAFGKQSVKKIRAQGYVPIVLYSKETETQSMMVKENELIKCLNTESGAHVIFNLLLVNSKETAMVQKIERHPLSRKVLHIDFKHINLKKEIETEIDLRIVGVAIGVKLGGELLQRVKKIRIRCIAEKLPKHYDVDISALNMGDVLRISDLHHEEIQIVYPIGETVVATVDKPKSIEVEAEAVAAVAPAATGAPATTAAPAKEK